MKKWIIALITLRLIFTYEYKVDAIRIVIEGVQITSAREYLHFMSSRLNAQKIDQFMEVNGAEFVDLNPTVEEINLFINHPLTMIPHVMQIKRDAIQKRWAKNGKDFLGLLEYGVPNPHDAYKTVMGKFLDENVGAFIDLNPTIEEINALAIHPLTAVPHIMQVKRDAIRKGWAKNGKDFLALIGYGVPNPSDKYKEAMSKFVAENVWAFIPLHPTIEEINEFIKQPITRISHIMQVKKEAIQKGWAKNGKDFLGLLEYGVPNPNDNYKEEMSKFVNENVWAFSDLNPTIEEINEFSTHPLTTVSHIMQVKRDAIRKGCAKNTKDFFALIHTPTDGYKQKMGELVQQNIDVFISFNPTLVEIDRLIELHPHVEKSLHAIICAQAEAEMKDIHTLGEYIAFCESMPNLPIAAITVDHFISLSPTLADINRLIERNSEVESTLKPLIVSIIQEEMKRISTVEEYLSFWDQQVPRIKKYLNSTVDHFISRSPTIEQINCITQWSTLSESNLMELKKDALQRRLTKNMQEYVTLLKYGMSKPSDDYKEAVSRLIVEQVDVLQDLNPSVEEVRRLIDQHPTIVESVAFLTLPSGRDPLSERIEQIQQDAFQHMQRVCDEWKGKIKEQKTENRPFLQDSIVLNILNCKKAIVRETQKMRREVQGIQDWEKARKANWERLNRLEKDFHQIVQRTNKEINDEFTRMSYPNLKGCITIPKHLLNVIYEKDVDWYLSAHNAKLSAASSTSSSSSITSSCLVCEEEPVDEEKVLIAPCNHLVCKGCLRNHIRENLEENHLPIRCVATGCNTWLEEKYIAQAGMEGVELEKWRKQTLLKLSHVIRCPRDECDAFLLRDRKVGDVLCGKCYKAICLKCMRSAHPGVDCQSIRDYIEYYLEGENGFKKLMEADIIQRCPHCQAPTIRTSACLHIDCKKCGKRWNYRGDYRSDEDKTIQ